MLQAPPTHNGAYQNQLPHPPYDSYVIIEWPPRWPFLTYHLTLISPCLLSVLLVKIEFFSENEVHLVSQIPIIHLSICIVLILFWNIASH